ncbi:amidohydrolase [Marmoricola sp. OAE513]|uniref:amidohydrolase n=1 Tax=Marmoricola sp. OAE513 TaxID=2817894 RepID=UPI001DF039DD
MSTLPPSGPTPGPTSALIDRFSAGVDRIADDLIEVRRELHAHPELSWREERTTALVAKRLGAAGIDVTLLPGSGLYADLGHGTGPIVALRADLDALPVADRTGDPWASTVDGVAHACGHDVHTSSLIGVGLALNEIADELPGRVRLIFQPAEEIMPGGALMSIEAGVMASVGQIYMLHCDPSLDIGRIGLREGPLTGAADSLEIELSGRGGHTSRPHLTEDLTFALGKLVTELPAVLSRRLDPRAGVSVVWGMLHSGAAMNVIPSTGRLAGTVRMLDAVAWADAEQIVRETIAAIVSPYGVSTEVTYTRGVPPVVNATSATRTMGAAIEDVLGPEGLVSTAQSLGGEDFAWYLERASGAMARLGTRTPGGPTYDLHQGDLRIDEAAIGIGAKVLGATAIRAL